MTTDAATAASPRAPAANHRLLAIAAMISPIYFAMVMATGIVSSAAQLLGMPVLALVLFWLNIFAYAVVWVATLFRLALDPRSFFVEMIGHRSGPVFFTAVAASCVLGSEFVVMRQDFRVATFLWVLAIVEWIGLNYTVFTAFTVKETKPTLADGISGAWLLGVVSTQSVAFLGALLAAHWTGPAREQAGFLALSMWLWGGMLYIWMISLIFYRYTFFDFLPGDLAPPYWINMGAMAISALAGSLLITAAPGESFLQSLLPFIKGFTVFFWATGTWWIPMLLILGVWRHGWRRFPLRYDPLYWGAVFPLGMYTAATFRMAGALKLPFLLTIPRCFQYAGLAAWALTFAGLVSTIVRGVLTAMKSKSLKDRVTLG